MLQFEEIKTFMPIGQLNRKSIIIITTMKTLENNRKNYYYYNSTACNFGSFDTKK